MKKNNKNNMRHQYLTNTVSIDNERSYNYDRDCNTLEHRIKFARKLLNNSGLEPIVDYSIKDTEYYINLFKSYNTYNNTNSAQCRKKYLDFIEVISKMGIIKYIKSGSTGHTFKGIHKQDSYTDYFAVKAVAYPKKNIYGKINNMSRPENAELMMIGLLTMLTVKGETPHIILPYGTFYTDITHFTNLIKERVINKNAKHYKEFIERYKNNEYYDKISILISEWANRGDFLDFIKKNYLKFELIHWKVFFFQILSVLAVIQHRYPSFRHNDFKPNNILIHKSKKKRGKWCQYIIGNNKYIIPNKGYKLYVWDFDFACIPGTIDNDKVNSKWTDRINVRPEQNRYYDMHYFFNTLIKKGFFPQFLNDDAIPIEAKKFVERIVPHKYRKGKFVDKRGRILIKNEYLIPDQVLKTDVFFEEFRKHKMKIHPKRNIKSTKYIDMRSV